MTSQTTSLQCRSHVYSAVDLHGFLERTHKSIEKALLGVKGWDLDGCGIPPHRERSGDVPTPENKHIFFTNGAFC